MAASFYERVLGLGDYENDGGIIDVGEMGTELVLYEASLTTAAAMKTKWSLTGAQGTDLDDILATMPNTLITLVQAAARARWAAKTFNVFKLGCQTDSRFDTVAELKTALGI